MIKQQTGKAEAAVVSPLLGSVFWPSDSGRGFVVFTVEGSCVLFEDVGGLVETGGKQYIFPS